MNLIRGRIRQKGLLNRTARTLELRMNPNTIAACHDQIRRAKQFILNPYFSVEEIAIESGFNSTEAFCEAFDVIVGESPYSYQSRIREAMEQIALGRTEVTTIDFSVEDSTEFELACAAA